MTEEDKHVEPDAWMSYNNMGGAGLVPYLLKSKAEDNTNLANGEGPETYNKNDIWPQPLFSASTIRQLWIDDFKPCIKGEAEELREREVAEDVAKQLEHLTERFEEVFSSDDV